MTHRHTNHIKEKIMEKKPSLSSEKTALCLLCVFSLNVSLVSFVCDRRFSSTYIQVLGERITNI